MCGSTKPLSKRRRGLSLLEVVMAGALLATALVPALSLIRRSMASGRDVEVRERLATYCVSKMEEHLALVSADWQTGTYSGNFSADGYASSRFQVVRSDTPGDGGVNDQLMSVTVTTWEDSDGDSVRDAGEPAVVMATKVAKLASYVSEAGGG
jgi:Tfp pilus assembly protein PilV